MDVLCAPADWRSAVTCPTFVIMLSLSTCIASSSVTLERDIVMVFMNQQDIEEIFMNQQDIEEVFMNQQDIVIVFMNQQHIGVVFMTS